MENYEDDSDLILPQFDESELNKLNDEDGAAVRNSGNSEGGAQACATSHRIDRRRNSAMFENYNEFS